MASFNGTGANVAAKGPKGFLPILLPGLGPEGRIRTTVIQCSHFPFLRADLRAYHGQWYEIPLRDQEAGARSQQSQQKSSIWVTKANSILWSGLNIDWDGSK